MTYAPICLFTYNRLFETERCIEALKRNNIAYQCELYIFSDGPKNEKASQKIKEVRNYLKTIDGFKKVHIKEAQHNKGLATSIIEGVSEVINQYGKIIVLEDDLVTAPNFLSFMNQALDFYQNNDKVLSVSGYTLNLPSLKKYQHDAYFGVRSSSWGWGTWKDKWNKIDWEVPDYENFSRSYSAKQKFREGGSDLPYMLKKQMQGKIDSWAIRFCYHQFKYELASVQPTSSKVMSIGFGENATHTKHTTRFNTPIDTNNQQKFVFESQIKYDKRLLKEFRQKFSILSRIQNRINALTKLK